jgi:hypothetical protein
MQVTLSTLYGYSFHYIIVVLAHLNWRENRAGSDPRAANLNWWSPVDHQPQSLIPRPPRTTRVAFLLQTITTNASKLVKLHSRRRTISYQSNPLYTRTGRDMLSVWTCQKKRFTGFWSNGTHLLGHIRPSAFPFLGSNHLFCWNIPINRRNSLSLKLAIHGCWVINARWRTCISSFLRLWCGDVTRIRCSSHNAEDAGTMDLHAL